MQAKFDSDPGIKIEDTVNIEIPRVFGSADVPNRMASRQPSNTSHRMTPSCEEEKRLHVFDASVGLKDVILGVFGSLVEKHGLDRGDGRSVLNFGSDHEEGTEKER